MGYREIKLCSVKGTVFVCKEWSKSTYYSKDINYVLWKRRRMVKGKNILITGASQGIGAKTAEYLSEQGATVILVARNEEKLKKVQERLKTKSYLCPYDLQDLDNIKSIFDYCAGLGMKLHGMIYCAGINRDVPISGNRIGFMKETMTVNYMAFVECGKFFMKKKYSEDNSSVVALSSIVTSQFARGMCTYASSKAALEAAVKVMSKETLRRKIRVNAIAPSCVDTEMVENAPFLTSEGIEATQPLGLIEPIYISYLIEYLLSDKSKYITGATIPVSSGVSLGG